MRVGKLLKSMRIDRELTRKEVALAIGVKYTTLAGYENDQIDPPTSKIIKLLEFYHVNPFLFLAKGEEYICVSYLSDVARQKIHKIELMDITKEK